MGNDNEALGKIVMGFVILLVGIIFLIVVADQITGNVELSAATNESITITNTVNTVTNGTITISSGAGNTGNASITTLTFFGNATNSTDLASVSFSVEVNFTMAGSIIVASDKFGDGDYNISYTFTTEGTGSTAQDDVVGLSFFGNATNNTNLASTTIGVHVNFTKPGVISVDTTKFAAGVYNGSYSYQGDLFVDDSASRPLLRLVILMFAIALVGLAIFLVKETFPEAF